MRANAFRRRTLYFAAIIAGTLLEFLRYASVDLASFTTASHFFSDWQHLELVPAAVGNKTITMKWNNTSNSNSNSSNNNKSLIEPIDSPNFNKNEENNSYRFVFMHVGKTGGTTIRKHALVLGCKSIKHDVKRNHCLAPYLKNRTESTLSKQTKGIFHYEKNFGLKIRKATDYMFAIREPISRFESWFRFQAPYNCIERADGAKKRCTSRERAMSNSQGFEHRFWYDCFPSVEALTWALVPNHTTDVPNRTDCLDMVRAAFSAVGKTRYGHLSAGYRFYRKRAIATKPKWAVRTEFLWHDLQQIDLAVGGTGNFNGVQGKQYTHGSENFHGTQQLNDSVAVVAEDGSATSLTKYACCALWPELMAYRDIVESAKNLNQTDKIETYQMTWSRCNVTSWEMLEEECGHLRSTLMM